MSRQAPSWDEAPDWAEALGLRIYESDTAAINYAWVSRHGYHYTDSNVVDKKCHPFDRCGTGIRDFKLISFRPLGPARVPDELPAWNGDHLPPVGTVCEFKANILGWVEVTITAVTDLSIVFTRPSYQNGRPLVEDRLPHKAIDRFRPIRTPEQIAAKERENAIAEMACIVRSVVGCGVNMADMAALYDAGFRKQEPKPE